MTKNFEILEAPLSTGIGLLGVEQMADALRTNGLVEAVGATACKTLWEPYCATEVDPAISLPEPAKVRGMLLHLADHVQASIGEGNVPIVIGGDCTILLGCLAGAKRHGDLGMLFLDAHTDFHKPGKGKTEPASMELYLATGRGPAEYARLEGDAPLIAEKDVVCLGYRNGDRPYTGSADPNEALSPADTEMMLIPLDIVRKRSFGNAVDRSLKHLCTDGRDFWLHVDVDVLDDALMPAVDYRLPDGLSDGELVEIIRRAMRTGRVRGINVAIFNPTLDWDGTRTKFLVDLLGSALAS